MKRHLALASLLLAQSCVVPSLEDMEATKFSQFTQSVESAATIGFVILKPKISDKARDGILAFAAEARAAMEDHGVIVPSSFALIIDYLAFQLEQRGVSAQEIALVRASMILVDNALGGIRLGVDGIGSDRTRAVILAMAKGLELGLR